MKDVLKNPGWWIVVFLILFGVLIFFLVSSLSKEENSYLLLSNISSYSCSKDYTCKSVLPEKIMEDTTKENFMLYQQEQLLGEYKIDYVNKWNFIDLNGNWENIQDSFIAGSKSMQLDIKDFYLRKMNNEELKNVNQILKNKEVTYSHLDQDEVLEYDFDTDGKLEKIILLSNADEDSQDEKLFSCVIGVVDKKYEIIHLDIHDYFYKVPAYNVKNIISMFNRKEALLVLIKGYYSEEGIPTGEIYQVKKKFISIIND